VETVHRPALLTRDRPAQPGSQANARRYADRPLLDKPARGSGHPNITSA
jgi:hypothetical protein